MGLRLSLEITIMRPFVHLTRKNTRLVVPLEKNKACRLTRGLAQCEMLLHHFLRGLALVQDIRLNARGGVLQKRHVDAARHRDVLVGNT